MARTIDINEAVELVTAVRVEFIKVRVEQDKIKKEPTSQNSSQPKDELCIVEKRVLRLKRSSPIMELLLPSKVDLVCLRKGEGVYLLLDSDSSPTVAVKQGVLLWKYHERKIEDYITGEMNSRQGNQAHSKVYDYSAGYRWLTLFVKRLSQRLPANHPLAQRYRHPFL